MMNNVQLNVEVNADLCERPNAYIINSFLNLLSTNGLVGLDTVHCEGHWMLVLCTN